LNRRAPKRQQRARPHPPGHRCRRACPAQRQVRRLAVRRRQRQRFRRRRPIGGEHDHGHVAVAHAQPCRLFPQLVPRTVVPSSSTQSGSSAHTLRRASALARSH
jgi:hypothetical protein